MAKKDLADDLTVRAFRILQPPFHHEIGYIWDANGNMVADDPAGVACQLRGWGRLQKGS